MRSKLNAKLLKYRDELRKYTTSTKDLEEKYTKINIELNEMKQKHECFITNHNLPYGDFETNSYTSSSESEYSLRRKCIQIFHSNNSFIQNVSNVPLKTMHHNFQKNDEQLVGKNYRKIKNVDRRQQSKESVTQSQCWCSDEHNLKNVYKAYKNTIDNNSKSYDCSNICSLENNIRNIKKESKRFCSVIEQQKNTLENYRLYFTKAKEVIKKQQIEIEKLNSSNQQLEKVVSANIDQLRLKIEDKLKDEILFSELMHAEQIKREQLIKSNCILYKQIQNIEAKANQLRLKLEEMSQRKIATITRLKAVERDLKIFKNYSTVLKQENQKFNQELQKINNKIKSMKNITKHTINRQREHNEQQRRDLQKIIIELEIKCNRGKNYTTRFIQDRNSLISELQNQLNNLVNNFEISQKHT